MKTMNDYLEQDGSIAFFIGIASLTQTLESYNTYTEICGGYIEGIHQWATHNVEYVEECKNDKYTGWKIYWRNSQRDPGQYYVPNWVMNANVNGWKHAKNLFKKYLRSAN